MYLTELAPWQAALLLLPILPNLWAIWHAARHTFPTSTEKVWWTLGAIFFPVLGGLAYLIFGMRRARPYGFDNSGETGDSNPNHS